MAYVITQESEMSDNVYIKNIGWRVWKFDKNKKFAYVIIKSKRVYANQMRRMVK